MRECSRAKQFIWVLLGLAFLVAVSILYWWFTPGRTPHSSEPTSIASLECLRIGGVEQHILIRGVNTSLPVLLFLHGGSGVSAMYLGSRISKAIEKRIRGPVGSPGNREILPQGHPPNAYVRTTDCGHSRIDKPPSHSLSPRQDLFNRAFVGHIFRNACHCATSRALPRLCRHRAACPFRSSRHCDSRQLYSPMRKACREVVKELDEKGADVREELLFRFGGEIHHAQVWEEKGGVLGIS
jgi:hypothetical protein